MTVLAWVDSVVFVAFAVWGVVFARRLDRNNVAANRRLEELASREVGDEPQ